MSSQSRTFDKFDNTGFWLCILISATGLVWQFHSQL